MATPLRTSRVQTIHRLTERGHECVQLPPANSRVNSGLRWGRADVLFTPAFWAAQAFLARHEGPNTSQRFGSTFREEVVACLLCTHGLPSEVGLAAFGSLKAAGQLEPGKAKAAQIERVLARPMRIGDRSVRYRFPRQKALAVYDAIQHVPDAVPTTKPVDLRAFLESIYGIGPKVASWITRNVLQSEAVAVIDIHVFRAGLLTGFFGRTARLPKDYLALEAAFLGFAAAISVRSSLLDSIMWHQMRLASAGRLI